MIVQARFQTKVRKMVAACYSAGRRVVREVKLQPWNPNRAAINDKFQDGSGD